LLEQRPSLRRLAANPLLCAMICALHLERRSNLPTERIKLYEECIDMLMEQRDVGRGVSQEDYPALGTAQRLALLQDLAYRMMRNGEIRANR
jgi:predicted NACHT family NTPase